MQTLTSKLPQVGTTIFTVMSGLAQKEQAINLSQGFPDFPVSEELIRLVHEAMQSGKNQYAPMAGVPALREAIAEKAAHCYGVTVDPDEEITVTAGGTEALFAAVQAIVRPGDEVIVLEPCYDCYIPAVELAGGKPIAVPLLPKTFGIDWAALRAAINPNTRALMFNTPHNPSGTILSRADLLQLESLLEGTDIYLISDEVYEHIVFDGQAHATVLKYPHLRERSFAVFSFGKTFHATGWKTGYCIAPPALTKELRKIHQYLTFCSFGPAQHGLAAYMRNAEHYDHLPSFYQEKRDAFCNLMKQTRFELAPAGGTYFQTVDYSHITDEQDTDFAVRLTKEYGVAAIPVSVFYHNEANKTNMLRFCFAKEVATLEAAAEKLMKV